MLNDYKMDNFFDGVAQSVSKKSEEDALVWLKDSLVEKYDTIVKKCQEVTHSSLMNSVDDESGVDLMDLLMGEFDHANEVMDQKEDKDFKTVVLPELKHVELKDPTLELLVQPPIDESEEVLPKKVHRIIIYPTNDLQDLDSRFVKEIEMNSSVSSDEEDYQDIMFEHLNLSGDNFEDSLEYIGSQKEIIVSGVQIPSEIASLVEKKSSSLINRAESMIVNKPDNTDIKKSVKDLSTLLRRSQSAKSFEQVVSLVIPPSSADLNKRIRENAERLSRAIKKDQEKQRSRTHSAGRRNSFSEDSDGNIVKDLLDQIIDNSEEPQLIRVRGSALRMEKPQEPIRRKLRFQRSPYELRTRKSDNKI